MSITYLQLKALSTLATIVAFFDIRRFRLHIVAEIGAVDGDNFSRSQIVAGRRTRLTKQLCIIDVWCDNYSSSDLVVKYDVTKFSTNFITAMKQLFC